MDKAKASKVFAKLAKANPTLASVGLMYAKDTQADGVRHSITDPDSPVKGQESLESLGPGPEKTSFLRGELFNI